MVPGVLSIVGNVDGAAVGIVVEVVECATAATVTVFVAQTM
jgi:hypothetical protein